MEKFPTTQATTSTNALSYAILVGMFGFLLARASSGGLSGVQGFFVGTLLALTIFFAAEILTYLQDARAKNLLAKASKAAFQQFATQAEKKLSSIQAESVNELPNQIHRPDSHPQGKHLRINGKSVKNT